MDIKNRCTACICDVRNCKPSNNIFVFSVVIVCNDSPADPETTVRSPGDPGPFLTWQDYINGCLRMGLIIPHNLLIPWTQMLHVRVISSLFKPAISAAYLGMGKKGGAGWHLPVFGPSSLGLVQCIAGLNMQVNSSKWLPTQERSDYSRSTGHEKPQNVKLTDRTHAAVRQLNLFVSPGVCGLSIRECSSPSR